MKSCFYSVRKSPNGSQTGAQLADWLLLLGYSSVVCLGSGWQPHQIKEECEITKSTRQKSAIQCHLIMVLYGVTIKHLESIHKVMQSIDSTFIFNDISSNKKFILRGHGSNAAFSSVGLLFVTPYNNSILTSFTYPGSCKLTRAIYKMYTKTREHTV